MKNLQKLALLVVLFISINSLNAQTFIGLRAGVGINNWKLGGEDLEEEPDLDNFSSYVFSIPFEIGITKNFAIQPELSFTQKGTQQSEDFGTVGGIDIGEFSAKYKFTYIEIPVLAKIKVGSESAGLGIFAGPSFSYATKGEFTTTFMGETETVDFFEQEEDSVNRSDLNLQAGVSPYFNLGNLKLFLDARYLFGLSDLDTEDDDASIKNRSLQLSVGLMFAL